MNNNPGVFEYSDNPNMLIRDLRRRVEAAETDVIATRANAVRLQEQAIVEVAAMAAELADVVARAERAEAALAERDKLCVWEYKRYGGWFTACQVRPEKWSAAWKFCPFCGHPIKSSRDAKI